MRARQQRVVLHRAVTRCFSQWQARQHASAGFDHPRAAHAAHQPLRQPLGTALPGPGRPAAHRWHHVETRGPQSAFPASRCDTTSPERTRMKPRDQQGPVRGQHPRQFGNTRSLGIAREARQHCAKGIIGERQHRDIRVQGSLPGRRAGSRMQRSPAGDTRHRWCRDLDAFEQQSVGTRHSREAGRAIHRHIRADRREGGIVAT